VQQQQQQQQQRVDCDVLVLECVFICLSVLLFMQKATAILLQEWCLLLGIRRGNSHSAISEAQKEFQN